MFNLLKILQKKFKKQHAAVQLIIAIVLILLARYLFNILVYSNFAGKYLENFGTPKQLVYFHMTECGHCKKFTPEWEKFVQGYTGNIKLKKVERKEAGEALLQK